MLYFDRPGAVFLILMLVGPILLALAGVRLLYGQEPRGWDAIYAMLAELGIIVGTLLVVSAFISQMYDEYKRVNGDNPKPKVNESQSQARTIPNLNAVYEFQGQTVRLDPMSRKIKHFCIVLINQRDNGYKIDLREVTWKSHFGGHDNYVNVRDVRLAGAFAKEHPERVNSPFVVVDWRAVEDGANGRLKH